MRESVDCDIERAQMAGGRADRAHHHREIGDCPRGDGRGRLEQDRDVEMVLQENPGFDGLLAAAIDENDAFAFETDDGRVRQGFVCRRQKRGHLRSATGRVTRPAGRLADIDILNGSGARESCRRLDEARGFLRATDCQRRILAGDCLEPVDFRSAKLAHGCNRAALTTATHRLAVKRHRALARADQYIPDRFWHAQRPSMSDDRLNYSRTARKH